MKRKSRGMVPFFGFQKNGEWRQRLDGLTRRARGAISKADARIATRQLLHEFARHAYEIQDLMLEERIPGEEIAELVSPLTALTILLNRKAPGDAYLKRVANCRLRWPVVCDAQKDKRQRETTALCDSITLGHGFMGKRVKPMKAFDRFVFELAVTGDVELCGKMHHSPWGLRERYFAALDRRSPMMHFNLPFRSGAEVEQFIAAVQKWLMDSVFRGHPECAMDSDLFGKFFRWDKRGDGKSGAENTTVFWGSMRAEMRRVIASIPLLRTAGEES